MKILLLRVEKPEVSITTQEHLAQIQSVDASIEIEAPLASDRAEIAKHLADSDVIAGFPFDLAEVAFEEAKSLQWVHTSAHDLFLRQKTSYAVLRNPDTHQYYQ